MMINMINDPLKQLLMDRNIGDQATMGPSASMQQPTMMGAGLGGAIGSLTDKLGGNAGVLKPAPWQGIDTAPVMPSPKPGMWEPPTGQPGIPTKTPPAWKRWDTGQKMIKGYQNNWNPNPMMTRLTEND